MNAGAVGGTAVGVPGSKNQVTTALLDYQDTDSDSEEDGQGNGGGGGDDDEDDDDDDEGEDFDLYDDENIVVTTFTTPATPRPHELSGGRRTASGSGAGSSAAGTTTTTSIRLMRKSDESIIWVSNEDANARTGRRWRRPASLRRLFQYEMFY